MEERTKEGKKEGRKEGRKQRKKEGKKKGKKERHRRNTNNILDKICKKDNILMAWPAAL